MSKRSDLLCVLLLSLLLLAASLRLPAAAGSNRQLVVAAAAARIGDEFLCQDPIGRPSSSSSMSSNASDELSSLPAAPVAAFTQQGFTAPAAAFTQEGFTAPAAAFAQQDFTAPAAAFAQQGFTAPAAAFTQEGFLGDEAFSSGDRYPKEDEDELLSGDGYARDLDRSVEEEPLGEEEEDEDDLLLLSVKQGAQVEPSSNNYEEPGSSADVQCPECGKLFRNDKSMFGHLRSHPNRGYKKGSGHLKSRPSRGYKPPARPKPLPSRNGKPSPLPNRNGKLSPPANVTHPVARYSQRDPELNRFEVMMAYVMLTLKQRGDGVARDQSYKRKHESSEVDVPKKDLARSKTGDDVALGDKHGTSVAEMVGDDVVHRSEQGSSLVEMAVDDSVLSDKHGTSVAEMPGDDAVHRSEQGSSLVEMAVDDVVLGDKNSTSVAEMAGNDVVLGDKHGISVAEMPGDDAVYRSEQGSFLVEMAGADVVLPNEHHGSVAVMAGNDVVHGSEQGSSLAEMAGDDVMLGDKHGISVADMPGHDAVHRNEQGSSLAEMAGDDVVLPNEHHGSVAVMAGDAVLIDQHGTVEVPRKKGRKKSKESTEARRKEKKVPSASTVKRSYTCKQCKAEFPTHQALGGHMAAHNKDKRLQAQNEQAAAAWEAHQNQIDRSLNRLVTSSMKPAWEAHQSQKDQSLNRQETKGGGEEPRQGGGMFMSTRELLMERYTKLFNQGWLSRQEAGGSTRQHTEKKDGGSPSVAPPLADGGRRRPFDIDLNAVAPEKE